MPSASTLTPPAPGPATPGPAPAATARGELVTDYRRHPALRPGVSCRGEAPRKEAALTTVRNEP